MKDKSIAFVGHLAEGSPLIAIFPDKRIPLRSPTRQPALLEDSPNAYVYMLSLPDCTPSELEALALFMSEQGRGPLIETRRCVQVWVELPIREINIAGVSMPLRLFV